MVKKVEDIYPLTIISMRYGGKIIIFNAYSSLSDIETAAEDEDVFYDIENWLIDNIAVNFGIGDSIDKAFEDYLNRNK